MRPVPEILQLEARGVEMEGGGERERDAADKLRLFAGASGGEMKEKLLGEVAVQFDRLQQEDKRRPVPGSPAPQPPTLPPPQGCLKQPPPPPAHSSYLPALWSQRRSQGAHRLAQLPRDDCIKALHQRDERRTSFVDEDGDNYSLIVRKHI